VNLLKFRNCVVALSLVCVLTGCSTSPVDEARDAVHKVSDEKVGDLPDDGPARERFEEAQLILRDSDGFAARGSIVAEGQVQSPDVSVDLLNDGFAGNVSVVLGEEELTVEIVRARKITWVKGPAAFWRTLGYSEEGAAVAEPKYVAFTPEAGDSMIEPYDYASIARSASALSNVALTVEGVVDFEGEEAYRYRLGEDEGASRMDVPVSGDLSSIRFVNAGEDIDAVVVFNDFGGDHEVTMPDPEDVLQP